MSDLSLVITSACVKIILSKPKTAEQFKKIVIAKKDACYMVEKFTDKQAFHEKINSKDLCFYCEGLLLHNFSQLNAWDENYEYSVLSNRKGNLSIKKIKLQAPVQVNSAAHNREKNYIIPVGTVVPPLVDMGVFTREGKVVNAMYDKFKQINRFIEIIDDAVSSDIKELNVIDFGCGKSYLTFILYYYLTRIKGIKANITGLDLKKEVIDKCNTAAQKYGYENLVFEVGNISGYAPKQRVDMVISLHACDTATDHALFNAVKWDAKMIFSVPCCQHELNDQLKSQNMQILSRYGIIKERFAALATDAIRANMLTVSGYKTQVLEFVDLSHTPKNLLLRAVKANVSKKTKQAAMQEINALIQEFGFTPSLLTLLNRQNCDILNLQ